MTYHVFLSYSSRDKERVRPIVQLLENHGYSVWWDQKILPGQTFDETIEKGIEDSRCVVVVWSENSIKSKWVRAEASEGERKGKLIPILVDNVTIPIAFRLLEAAVLVNWDGRSDHPEIKMLLDSLQKYADPDSEIVDPNISEEIYDALQKQEYELVIKLSDLRKIRRLPSDQSIRIAVINRAIALKALGRLNEMNVLLDGFDWSSCSPKFLLAVHALKGDEENFYRLLPIAIAAQEVNRSALESWPLFMNFRNKDRFIKIVNTYCPK